MRPRLIILYKIYISYPIFSNSNSIGTRAILHRVTEAAAPLRAVPVGTRRDAVEGQPGKLAAACHRLH